MKRKRKDPLITFGDERRLVRHWATVYDLKNDFDYEDCGWKNKRKFICEEKYWFGGE